MSTPERDPFEMLPRFVDPEPDPVVMNATIAQSRDAFLRRQHRAVPPGATSWWTWLRRLPRWLLPVGAGSFALAAAVVMTTGVLQTTPPSNPANGQAVADGPAVAPPSAEAPPILSRGEDAMVADAPDQSAQNTGGVRMGMQPMPRQEPVDSSLVPMSLFDGDDVRLGFRLTPAALLLYLPEISTEAPIDSQGIVPGEELEVLAAFGLPEQDLVAVQIRVDSTRFWRAYRPVNGAYGRDVDLSALILDAPDEAEARRRLTAN